MKLSRILLNIWRYGRTPNSALIAYRALRHYKLVKNSEFYDADWVRKEYLSLDAADSDPIFFLLTSTANAVNPSLGFCSQEYAEIHGISPSQNALVHYESVGKKKGYAISYLELEANNGKRHGLFCHQRITEQSILQSLENAKDAVHRKIERKSTLNIVFLVYNFSIFPARPLCDLLLTKHDCSVKIIVISDLRWPSKTAALRNACLSEAMANYDNKIIVDAADSDTANDIMRKADIVCYSTPYDLSESIYNVRYSFGRSFLPIYFNYSYVVANFSIEVFKSSNFLFFWKVFFEHNATLNEYKQVAHAGGRNAVLSGYVKMDSFAQEKQTPHQRKRIIIAPHHSFTGGYNRYLHISNFIEYADFFKSLPAAYPEIDFILRPHPFFRQALSEDWVWGKSKTDSYFNTLLKHSNFKIYTGPNYFKLFMDSDGIIQDCGSFLAEYFYSGKPQCYILKDSDVIPRAFTHFGKQCLNYCYKAYSESDIDYYLREVILKGNDPMRNARTSFSSKVMLNYPHASNVALNIIRREFQIA